MKEPKSSIYIHTQANHDSKTNTVHLYIMMIIVGEFEKC